MVDCSDTQRCVSLAWSICFCSSRQILFQTWLDMVNGWEHLCKQLESSSSHFCFSIPLKGSQSTCNNTSHPSLFTLISVYFSLGCLLAIDNFLYSLGLWFLPISTYFLICASQLVFNAIFSFVINSEKLTILILKSVILLTVLASLVAIHPDSSEEWKKLNSQMETFKKGRVLYVLSLVGAALYWQICTVGVVRLILLVFSLFSNVVNMLSLPFVPVVAVLFYHEKMDGIKAVTMLLTIWGFASYLYQQYLDDYKPKEKETDPIPGIEDPKLDGIADKLV
ncbi:hypothetical protein CRYUN_Cryun26dG0113900 [Craigia yunnanensis]